MPSADHGLDARAQTGATGRDLLVCAVILGLLAAILGPALFGDLEKGQRHASARSDMRVLANTLASYKLDNATYPSTRQGLIALVHPPTGTPAAPHWKGYLREPPADPWGNPYHYVAPSPHGGDLYVLWTYGSDGRPGGEESAADIFLHYPTDCSAAGTSLC